MLRELDFVLRNAGAGLRLAVSSRIDPLLPLHRWLSRLLPIPGWCFLNLLTFQKR